MQALVYKGPQIVEIEEMAVPACGAHEVLIRVESVGVCGSELEGYLGHSGIRKPPLVMGHEFAGRVESLGAQVVGLAAGDKVVVNPLIACGTCTNCSAGRTNICLSRQIVGIHRPGAFADCVAVPAANVHKLPDTMDARLASLAEPLAVAVHAVKLGMRSLEDLLIYGAGPIGLLCLQAARQMGAGRIAIADIQPGRLRLAEQWGAAAIDARDFKQAYKRTFPDGVSCVIDCAGVQATREGALAAVRSGGTIVMVGLGQDRSHLDVNDLVRREIALVGSYTYSPADFEQAIELLKQGRIDIAGWTEARPLAEAPNAFRELVEGRSASAKIFLTP
ncbi:zinc-dependent alcohol dehydrogenase [Paenibacillus sacheonensis]|uniref:Alcohol dehydrogenase catalytic domain-containing protein n=1 Tax=Paenibacillus sacheonensis TaxID=742054 RepID=A0A7X4YW67_9BACL|nr:galactitol-1-phosphate 5-dehydrogenase [Paenibacillus sacheonensis]MBM7568866.1 2-desacetyl-2-hydroxyethyl bacteriochlorophyllide A dehydrogenase [Paenibacillus sacheonensis]NBC72569.1 alcohol dehydrogenase catalytic domain-containing protein [Paenibacillus sacheonensis]